MNRFVVHAPVHTPTFASYCPEAGLDEFDAAQRKDEQFALRMLGRAVRETNALSRLGIERDFHLLSTVE